MNTRRTTSFMSFLSAAGLVLGIAACAPTQPTTTFAPSTTAADSTRSVQHVSLAADTYFGFNQAELGPEGMASLDALLAKMPGKQNPRIQITGYADRLGDQAYNLQLAQRRAEAVRDYLVSRGVETELIEINALGAHDPIVSCTGRTGADLIRCLGPNRRTVVEFSAFEVLDDGAQAQEKQTE